MTIDQLDPQPLRNTPKDLEIRPDEKPSDWIKRITGKKNNGRRK